MNPRRALLVVVSLLCLIGSGYWLWRFAIADDNSNPYATDSHSLWFIGLPSLAMLIACVVFGFWATGDNLYRVTSGKVTAIRFIPAHRIAAVTIPGTPPSWTPGTPASTYSPGTPATYSPGTPPITIPAHDVADDWEMDLDNGHHTGTLHFSTDPAPRYKVGDRYDPQTSTHTAVQAQ